MPVPQTIKNLITRFTENRESYSASTYNEAQLRQEFLNPFFEAPEKIVVRQTGDSIIAVIVDGSFYERNNLHIILPANTSYDVRYVLALLNSRLVDFCYTAINPEKGEALAEVKKQHVEQLPIHPINFDLPSEKKMHDNIVFLVSSLLELNKKIRNASGQMKIILQRQIDSTDHRIDELVYELYGLTQEEIMVVEGAQNKKD